MGGRKRKGRPWVWLLRVIGVIVPRRLRADWRQEWEAELLYRETLLAEWERLDRRNKTRPAVAQPGRLYGCALLATEKNGGRDV